jgi:ubiquinol-cytochrome c reductase subunit 7
MSFHREFAKLLSAKTKQLAKDAPKNRPDWVKATHREIPGAPVPEVQGRRGLFKRYRDLTYDNQVDYLRSMGLLYDDTLNASNPIVARAYELLPLDLQIHRARRVGRASHVTLHHTHLPHDEQNYDPMIPYMAPYIEEAKFQIQEEIELLQFHPWDRRLYSGNVSGFGETLPHSTFLAW